MRRTLRSVHSRGVGRCLCERACRLHGGVRASVMIVEGCERNRRHGSVYEKTKIGDGDHVARMMCAKQNGGLLLVAQFDEEFQEFALALRVEAGRGLVEKDDGCTHGKSASEQHTLLLPSGKFGNRTIGERVEFHPHERFLDDGGIARRFRGAAHHADDIAYCYGIAEVRSCSLRDVAHRKWFCRAFCAGCAPGDFATGRFDQAEQKAKQRSFATAVRADEKLNFCGQNFEIDVAQDEPSREFHIDAAATNQALRVAALVVGSATRLCRRRGQSRKLVSCRWLAHQKYEATEEIFLTSSSEPSKREVVAICRGKIGARDWSRTSTILRSLDPESSASANSATRARRRDYSAQREPATSENANPHVGRKVLRSVLFALQRRMRGASVLASDAELSMRSP